MQVKVLLSVGVILYSLPLCGMEIMVRDSVKGTKVEDVSLFLYQLKSSENSLSWWEKVKRAEKRGELVKEKIGFRTKVKRSLREGDYLFKLEANGYKPLRFIHKVEGIEERGSRERTPVVVWLDPAEVPPEVKETRRRFRYKGRAVFHGYVVSWDDGEPLVGARVYLQEYRLSTTTDEKGYFVLSFVPPRVEDNTLPPEGTLIVEKEGFKRYIENYIPLVRGDTLLRIFLEKGTGESVVGEKHKLYLPRNTKTQLGGDGDYDGDFSLDTRITTKFIPPPESIRVGFKNASGSQPCCTSSCRYTHVFSLETYVRRGLGDEWIASWHINSLRAGAIAYRSYGAWHVENPKTSSFDICSNACCQMNDPDTYSSTTQAVNDTSGIMLHRNGSIFRSEYSAENNSWNDPYDGLSCTNVDLSCGNGYVGSPSAGWPCLRDLVATDKGCFGHGRGMSQWGSYRWAKYHGKTAKWIVDHYYNANGNPSGLRSAFMTSPLYMYKVYFSPRGVYAGSSFTIYEYVGNWAEGAHGAVMLGATLVSPSGDYIDDPDNDRRVVLSPGWNDVSRSFYVPSGSPAGWYDIYLALWIDVDGDYRITSADAPMDLWYIENAVYVYSGYSAGDQLEVKVGEGYSVSRFSEE